MTASTVVNVLLIGVAVVWILARQVQRARVTWRRVGENASPAGLAPRPAWRRTGTNW
jgi:hypothetical protein